MSTNINLIVSIPDLLKIDARKEKKMIPSQPSSPEV